MMAAPTSRQETAPNRALRTAVALIAGDPLPPADAEWLGIALHDRVLGIAPTIDDALGLGRRKTRTVSRAARDDLIRKVARLKFHNTGLSNSEQARLLAALLRNRSSEPAASGDLLALFRSTAGQPPSARTIRRALDEA